MKTVDLHTLVLTCAEFGVCMQVNETTQQALAERQLLEEELHRVMLEYQDFQRRMSEIFMGSRLANDAPQL